MKITYSESEIFAIAQEIRNRGWLLAARDGHKTNEPERNHEVVGILEPQNPIEKKWLFFSWKKDRRNLFIGRIWINKPTWILEVYGRDNLLKLKDLAEFLSNKYDTQIDIILSRESLRHEPYEIEWGL
jgi:hypothetical protein